MSEIFSDSDSSVEVSTFRLCSVKVSTLMQCTVEVCEVEVSVPRFVTCEDDWI